MLRRASYARELLFYGVTVCSFEPTSDCRADKCLLVAVFLNAPAYATWFSRPKGRPSEANPATVLAALHAALELNADDAGGISLRLPMPYRNRSG